MLQPIRIEVGGRPTASETTLRFGGAYVAVLTTVLPDVPLTVVTVYVGADDVDSTAVELVLGRRPSATRRTREFAREELPATRAHARCRLDHLAQVRAALAVAAPDSVASTCPTTPSPPRRSAVPSSCGRAFA